MDGISADLAGKVLTANQRNIITKVQAGKTLSGPEMKIFEGVLAQQREFRERRQAALLRRYCDGNRLTPEELSEISELIPAAPHEDGAAAPEPTSYKQSRAHYAKLYGQTPRTINRWIAHGRSIGHLPPLDTPEAMAAWWADNMKHRVPQELLAMQAPAAPAPAPVTPPPSVSADTPPSVPAATGSPPGEVGMGAMLKRVREAERAAHEAYLRALAQDPPDPGSVEVRRRAWEGISEQMRKLEKDGTAILTASGDVLSRSEVVEAINQIQSTLALTWRSFARRMLPILRGSSIEQAEKIWRAETDRVFEKFRENKFAAPVEDLPAA